MTHNETYESLRAAGAFRRWLVRGPHGFLKVYTDEEAANAALVELPNSTCVETECPCSEMTPEEYRKDDPDGVNWCCGAF